MIGLRLKTQDILARTRQPYVITRPPDGLKVSVS